MCSHKNNKKLKTSKEKIFNILNFLLLIFFRSIFVIKGFYRNFITLKGKFHHQFQITQKFGQCI